MEISKVSLEDGKKCAQLLNILKSGRWDLTGAEQLAFMETFKWVNDLAIKMAKQLESVQKEVKSAAPAPASGGMKIKSIGKLPTSKQKKSKK